MRGLRKRLIFALVFITCVVLAGSVGYMLIEGWSCLDSLYMTVITIASVGYKEIHDLSPHGRIFTIILIISGVGSVTYALTTIAKIIVEGEIQEIFGRKKLEKRIKELKGHYIVCGYGRMGRIICRELKGKNIKFGVIEKEPNTFEADEETLILKGDATKDELLKEMGIEKAKGLISVLPTDAENLFVVLSARELNPKLFIVARAGEEGSEQKLLRAGADRVVSPYYIGGLRIAHTVLKPAVVDFIEFATKSGNIDLQMEEIAVQHNSKLAGLTLDECGIGRDLGIIVVAIKKASGDMKFNPTFRTAIKAGDTLIALGEIPKLRTLENMATAKG
ncbi:MAG: potassium channel protein [Nitrospirae bacterium CG_4_10_14_3_um_filter_44_29]|nr:MAG: potassium channel protein [Nitrospirae bacterium CG02_land_8_20_14_3_00_44_33]PIV65774.1 MAG: potassium channel protein [Nitrospirae bacterium CG01_land_8_20_14_3_00_44_22]PIX87720.1 MAG: potassium channel protein [Nitrospirae bacterium CG_4_10_14_3_um_filter_44_29]PJA83049.1 MAG: potassium channel protein [Nitrospirae bacterium CG_4_9_14_3_um_filter_44_28]